MLSVAFLLAAGQLNFHSFGFQQRFYQVAFITLNFNYAVLHLSLIHI